MTISVFIDTNIVLWAVRGEFKKLSKIAEKTISENSLLYSPMVRLELEYLYEIGKIRYDAQQFLNVLHKSLEINEANSSFSAVCANACKIGWTRDSFDRLIVAEADLHKAKLITADEKIIKNYKRAVW